MEIRAEWRQLLSSGVYVNKTKPPKGSIGSRWEVPLDCPGYKSLIMKQRKGGISNKEYLGKATFRNTSFSFLST